MLSIQVIEILISNQVTKRLKRNQERKRRKFGEYSCGKLSKRYEKKCKNDLRKKCHRLIKRTNVEQCCVKNTHQQVLISPKHGTRQFPYPQSSLTLQGPTWLNN